MKCFLLANLLLFAVAARADTSAPAAADARIGVRCPTWMGAAGGRVYWLAQSEPGEPLWRQEGRGSAPASSLGSVCSSSVSHSIVVTDDAIFCPDGYFRDFERVDARSGEKRTIALGGGFIQGAAADATHVYFGHEMKGRKYDVARVPRGGGAVQVLAPGAEITASVAVGDTHVVWLDTAGDLWEAPKGGGAKRRIAHDKLCAGEGYRAECAVATDGGQVFVASDARYGSHDACPRKVGQVRAFDRASGAVSVIASGLTTARDPRVVDHVLYWQDILESTVSSRATTGGPVRTTPMKNGIQHYAVDGGAVYWFTFDENELERCRLRSAPQAR